MTDEYIAISGGFDPVTIGHTRYISDASAIGRVIVLLNSDAWLIKKKGKAFMPFAQRKEILENIRGVHLVLPADDRDGTVSESLKTLKNLIVYFGKGGDRTKENTPEIKVCEQYNICMIFGLGGGKVASSSDFIKRAKC